MDITLKRIAKKQSYTIGKLYVDGKYVCDTIEDTDRGLDQKQDLEYIQRNKKYGITAIPTGKYEVLMDVKSPKYSTINFYKINANNGCVPRLKNVPGWDGVLIHCGNTAENSLGCIIVGQNKAVGKVLNSQETFKKLYKILQTAKDTIYITIQ